MRKKIKAYKGMRSKRIPSGRITTEDLEKLKFILKKNQLSFADWVLIKIKTESLS